MGQKALLAKKMAKGTWVVVTVPLSQILSQLPHSYRSTVSPTDNLMTPVTAKLSQAKKKHFA
ncbi:uncharacterized protein EI90DRAFT_3032774, partial [Cantharellus anzutake]|uniref:uncharacterized protein n=1 Tax=Cantharellus anzutake TaxID=1750568 RepID=UPI0019079BD5